MASDSQSARQVSADAGRGSGYERNGHDAYVDDRRRLRKAVTEVASLLLDRGLARVQVAFLHKP
jgi:hypothetical protein